MRSVLYTSEGEMIVPPPPPPGNPPQRSPRKSGTRSMQYKVGLPPPPPPGSPPTSSPRKRIQGRKDDSQRLQHSNTRYENRLSARETKNSFRTAIGTKKPKKDDLRQNSQNDERQRKVENTGSLSLSIIETRRKAALAIYESKNMVIDDNSKVVVDHNVSLRSTKENDFDGNDSMEAVSSDCSSQRKGLFRKFAGRGTKKNLSKRSSLPPSRRAKKNRSKIGIPFGAKPGTSYNSTPHSAEIVPRQAAETKILANGESEDDRNSGFEPFNSLRFDPPSAHDLTADDVSHLTDPTYGSPPKSRSNNGMMDPIEEYDKNVQQEPSGKRYDSQTFSDDIYSEENVGGNALRALADDVESLATTHATSVDQTFSNENKSNTDHESRKNMMEKIDKKALAHTENMQNFDNNLVSMAYCQGDTVNNLTSIGEKFVYGGKGQFEGTDKNTETPKVGNLSKKKDLYPEEIPDRIFGIPASLGVVKDESSTLEFQKALENDAKDATLKDRRMENLVETPRISNQFFGRSDRVVNNAPRIVSVDVTSDQSRSIPATRTDKTNNSFSKESSDETETTVTLSPESNLSEDLSSTTITRRQSDVRDSHNSLAKQQQRSLDISNINLSSSSSVQSFAESDVIYKAFGSKDHGTAETVASTVSSTVSKSSYTSPPPSQYSMKELRLGGKGRPYATSIDSAKFSNHATKGSSATIDEWELRHETNSVTTTSKISYDSSAVSPQGNKELDREDEDNFMIVRSKRNEVWKNGPSNKDVKEIVHPEECGKSTGRFNYSMTNLQTNDGNLKDIASRGVSVLKHATPPRSVTQQSEDSRMKDCNENRSLESVKVIQSSSKASSNVSSDSRKSKSSHGYKTSPLSKKHEAIMRLERLRKKRNMGENEQLSSIMQQEKSQPIDEAVISTEILNSPTETIARTNATSAALAYIRKDKLEQKHSFISDTSDKCIKTGPPTPENFCRPRRITKDSSTTFGDSFKLEQQVVDAKHLDVEPKFSSKINALKPQLAKTTAKEKSGKVLLFMREPATSEKTVAKRRKSIQKLHHEAEPNESFVTVGKLSLTALQAKQKRKQSLFNRDPKSAEIDMTSTLNGPPQMRLPIRHCSRQKHETSQNVVRNGYTKKRKELIEPHVVSIGLSIIRRKRRTLIEQGYASPIQPHLNKKKRLITPQRDEKVNVDESKMDPMQRAGFRVLTKSALSIQTQYRQHMARREAIDRLWAVMEVQSFFRRWRCEAYLYAHTWASTRIQSFFRGWQARDSVEEMQFCAIEIQRIIRGHLASIRIYDDIYRILLLQSTIRRWLAQNEAMRRLGAAIILQAVCRSFVIRLQVRKAIREATRIQAFFRGYSARLYTNRTKLEHESAVMIQKYWRGFETYKEYIFSVADIIIAQRNVRKWIAKRTLQVKKANYCAIKIQAQWRRYISQIRCLYKLVHIIIVQSTIRRWLAVDRVRNLRVEYLSAKIIQSWWRMLRLKQLRGFDSAATKIQASWRCFWESTQYLIINYEVVRIQAIVRGYQARIGASLQFGCAIMIQAAIRSYFARKLVEERKMEIVIRSSYSVYLRDKHAATCIQRGWSTWKTRRKEKKAAATIERFFIMVKAEVDRVIRLHNEEMKRTAMKLSSESREMDKMEEEKMLEVAWLHAIRSSPHDVTTPAKRISQIDPPLSSALSAIVDPPGKRINFTSHSRSSKAKHEKSYAADPRLNQVVDPNCGTPKKFNSSRVRSPDIKSNAPLTRKEHTFNPHQSQPQSYNIENWQSQRRESQPCDENSNHTAQNLFTRSIPARVTSLTCQELSEDLSLEEAWIDTEVRQVKQHVQQMRSDQRRYIERHGLDKSGSEESPNLRSRLYVRTKSHSVEYHGKSLTQYNQEFGMNHLSNQEIELNYAPSHREQTTLKNQINQNHASHQNELPHDNVYRFHSPGRSIHYISAQNSDKSEDPQAYSCSQIKEPIASFNVSGNSPTYPRQEIIVSPRKIKRRAPPIYHMQSSSESNRIEQKRFSPNASRTTNWHCQTSYQM